MSNKELLEQQKAKFELLLTEIKKDFESLEKNQDKFLNKEVKVAGTRLGGDALNIQKKLGLLRKNVMELKNVYSKI